MSTPSVRALLLLAFAAAPGTEAAAPRVFVLDPQGLSVTAVSLGTGEVLGKATLQGQPERALITADGSRLVVLDRGPGKATVRFGYHPTGKSWATVIDARTLAVVARTELCWNVDLRPSAALSGGGRLTLACLGYRSQKPEETLPRELVNLDLASGSVSGRVAIDRLIDDVVALPDSKTALVFTGRDTPKNQPAVDATVQFVDLVAPKVEASLTLQGDPGVPVVAPDGQHVYLLEQGKPDKKPEKNVNGRVQVLSVAARQHVTNLEAGRAPRGLVLDKEGNQVFVLAEEAPSAEKKGEPPGVLRVIRGAEEAARVAVAEEPLFLRVSPNRERLYVVSEKALTSVDLPSLSRLGSSVLKPAGISLATSQTGKSTVKELSISRDGKRGYVLYAQSSKLGILDLEAGKLVAEIGTGRGGVKFGKLLGAVALTAASYAAGSAGASASGSPVFFYNVYGVAPANTALVTTLDEKHVYVLNTNSNDVTIVDAETRTVVTKIGVGGSANRLELLPGGAFMTVTTGVDTLHLIDTKTHTKTSELPDGGNFVLAPGERYAAAIGKEVVYCLEAETLKVLGKATGFKKPTQLVFEPEPAAVPTAPASAEEALRR
jgi:YVTN family beta-propeller protein